MGGSMDSDVQKVQKIIDQCVLKPRYSYPMFKNAPRPPVDAYAAVRLMGTYSPGYDEYENKYDSATDEFIFTTKGFRILSFDVLFSRDDVDVDFLNNSFYRPDVLDLMKKLGMVLISKGPIKVKTLTHESQWEVRTAIRLDFNVIRKQETRIPRIVEAVVNGEVQFAEAMDVNNIPLNIQFNSLVNIGTNQTEEQFIDKLLPKLVSSAPDNRLTVDPDGLHVLDDLAPDPLSYYILSRS